MLRRVFGAPGEIIADRILFRDLLIEWQGVGTAGGGEDADGEGHGAAEERADEDAEDPEHPENEIPRRAWDDLPPLN